MRKLLSFSPEALLNLFAAAIPKLWRRRTPPTLRWLAHKVRSQGSWTARATADWKLRSLWTSLRKAGFKTVTPRQDVMPFNKWFAGASR
jgi:hypothetical protein